jgi:hypothetical protein
VPTVFSRLDRPVFQDLESLPRFWQGRQEAIDEWVILIRAGKTPDLDRFRARRALTPVPPPQLQSSSTEGLPGSP